MSNVLEVSAIKLSTPVTLVVDIEPCDLTFHKCFQKDPMLES